MSDIGLDIVETARGLVERAMQAYPSAVVFGGRLAFQKETVWPRWLHNHIVMAMQKTLAQQGVPFIVMPIKV